METEAAFLADIRAHPEDDGPRLVFADWLEDHGDPGRAELIRVECRLARLSPDHPAVPDLKRRREQLDGARKVWSRPLEQRSGVTVYESRRGLPAGVFIHLGRWRRSVRPRAAGLLAAFPWTNVYLSEVTLGRLAQVLSCPELRGVGELFLESKRRVGAQAGRLLGACPHLAGLRGLHVAEMGLRDQGAHHLARSPHLAELHTLNVCDNDLGPAAFEALARGRLARLRELWANGNEAGPDGAAALAGSANFAGLEELHLYSAAIGPRGAAALAGSPHLARLRCLDLYENDLGEEGALALAASAGLRNLEELHLQLNAIGPRGAAALAAGPLLEGARTLNLYANAIGPAGAVALSGSARLRRLEGLVLNSNRVGPEGAAALGSAGGLPCLRNLYLSSNAVGDEGVAAFLRRWRLTGLRRLDLSSNRLTDESARRLARAPLAGLEELDLSDNPIGDEGAAALGRSAALKGLTRLSLSSARLSPKAARSLERRFGAGVTTTR